MGLAPLLTTPQTLTALELLVAPLNSTLPVCQHQSGRVCNAGDVPERKGAGLGLLMSLMICSVVTPPPTGVRSKITELPVASMVGR